MNFYNNLLLLIVFLNSSFGSDRKTRDYSSFLRYPLCRACDDIRYPTNSVEVASIVQEAIYRGVTVKAIGNRHSATDIICTNGIPVDMSNVTSFKMNSDKTATFGAGVTLYEASVFLQQYERAFRVMPTFGNITLAGAVGTSSHGSSIKFHSSLSEQVAKMTIINGMGKKETIYSPEDLKSFKTHLGLLGIIVDITMYTVPLYKVKTHSHIVSDEILTNGTGINWARNVDQVTLCWFPSVNKVVVFDQTFVSANTAGNAYGHIIPTSSTEQSVFSTLYKETAFNLSTSDCQEAATFGNNMLHAYESSTSFISRVNRTFTSSYYSKDFVNPSVGYPHETLAAICSTDLNSESACSWLHPEPYATKLLDIEFACALMDLPPIVTTIQNILKKTPSLFLFIGILLRFSAKNDIYMSPAYERDSVHIEFYLLKRTDEYNTASGNLAGYQTILQVLTKEFGGRSHWGKSGLVYHSRPMLDLKLDFSARTKFIAAMKKFDPNGIFLNNFGRRLTQCGTKIDIDPLTSRRALLDNCFCSKNSDCADTQICTTISGYNYKVCETKKIVSAKFNESEFSTNFNIVEWFTNNVPALISSLKC